MDNADFYLELNNMRFIGSISQNGHPDQLPYPIIFSKTTAEYMRYVFKTLQESSPSSRLWEWLWEDSNFTDYAYTFYQGKVYCSYLGGPWFDPVLVSIGEDLKNAYVGLGKPNFPKMKRGEQHGRDCPKAV